MTDKTVETDDVWWMIERNDLSAQTYIGGCQTMYLCWLHEPGSKHFPHGQHSWTPDWQRGARFATREEAEAHTNSDPLLRVCDHSMMAMAEPSKAVIETDDVAGLADDLCYIAAHENDPRNEERIYRAATALQTLTDEKVALLARVGVLERQMERIAISAEKPGSDRERQLKLKTIAFGARASLKEGD